MAMVADTDGKEHVYVTASEEIESILLCTGSSLECAERVLSSEQFEKIGVHNSMQLFRSVVALEFQKTSYVIQGLIKGDLPGARRAFRLHEAE